MPRPKIDQSERKQSRTISLSLDEIAEYENYGLGSLSAGASELLKRHSELLIKYNTLNTTLKNLSK